LCYAPGRMSGTRLSRPTIAALLSATALILLSACGSAQKSSPTTTGSKPSGSITLYNGQHEQTTARLVKAFEAQTHVTVHVRSDDEDVLGNQIAEEGSSSPADVFYTENTPVLEFLREKNALATLDPATLAQVPSAYASPQKVWAGISARASVLVYNTKLISASALPSSILELASPRFKGKIGFAPSETDFQPLVSSIVKFDGQARAEAWLRGLKANGKVYPDNETVVAQVNNGESAVGLINHYYWYRLRDEVGPKAIHSALHYYAPRDPGDLLGVSGAAVVKSSGNPVAAQAFVAFLASAAGQQIIAHSESYEYPIDSGVQTAQPLRPFAQLMPAPISLGELGNGSVPLALEQKLGLL
jgi:iron(III) transport system substrate-binding protein